MDADFGLLVGSLLWEVDDPGPEAWDLVCGVITVYASYIGRPWCMRIYSISGTLVKTTSERQKVGRGYPASMECGRHELELSP